MTEETPPVIEIRDTALDAEAIKRRLQQQVAQRRAAGAYGPDPATIGPDSLQPGGIDPIPDQGGVGFPGLQESLALLIAKSHLDEPDFASSTPFAGPVIVAVRRMWNWMSTKWYVLPILRAQSDVNAHTARLLSDLAQWHELDARRFLQLENRVAELEARLVGLETGERS
jgi:hypothetical protein